MRKGRTILPTQRVREGTVMLSGGLDPPILFVVYSYIDVAAAILKCVLYFCMN